MNKTKVKQSFLFASSFAMAPVGLDAEEEEEEEEKEEEDEEEAAMEEREMLRLRRGN